MLLPLLVLYADVNLVAVAVVFTIAPSKFVIVVSANVVDVVIVISLVVVVFFLVLFL